MYASQAAAALEALHPPTALHDAQDSRRLGYGWCPDGSEAAAAARPAAAAEVPPVAGQASRASGAVMNRSLHVPSPSRPKPGKPRATLNLPPRELSVEDTVLSFLHLRKRLGLFKDLSAAELNDLAEACRPMGYSRSEVLFNRGELASWFGIILSGETVASVPGSDEATVGRLGGLGTEVMLGTHEAGEFVGAARVSQWQRSHVRAYTLRGIAAGFIAVLSFDQLEQWAQEKPVLHYTVLHMLLSQLADAAAGFFRRCPMSCGVRWPIVDYHERTVLDFLLEFRESKTKPLFEGVDYRALVALACRLRVAQWQAGRGVLCRGAPLTAALIVLEGKLTGFREPAAQRPSCWFDPGDTVGLEGMLGGVRPCAIDVFSARPTLAAVLFPADLEDLKREFPSFASQIMRALYARLFSELAEPHGRPLLLLAEASKRVHYVPGEVPALPSAPPEWPGNMSPADAEVALKLAETTAPSWFLGPAGAGRMHGLSEKQIADDLHVQQVMGRYFETGGHPDVRDLATANPSPEWILGSFLARKLVERPVETVVRQRGASPVRTRDRRLASAPPGCSRLHPEMLASDTGRQRRVGGSLSTRGLVKSVEGLDVTASEFDPSHPIAPHSSRLRRALASARSAARAQEVAEAWRGTGSCHPLGERLRKPWLPVKRSQSEPPPTKYLRPAIPSDRSKHDGLVTGLDDARTRPGRQDSLPFQSQRGDEVQSCGYVGRQVWADPVDSHVHHGAPTSRARAERRLQPPQAGNELQDYFTQQRNFLYDLRSSAFSQEESVCQDQFQAWNMKVIMQQEEITRLNAKVANLEAQNSQLRTDVAVAVQERDEWKSSALRMQLNREFKSTVDRLEADERRFLRPPCGNSMPDFEQSLKQQLQLAETPLQLLSAEGIVRHDAVEHHPPPALRTFPRSIHVGGAW